MSPAAVPAAKPVRAAAPARPWRLNWRLLLAVAFCATAWALLLKGCL